MLFADREKQRGKHRREQLVVCHVLLLLNHFGVLVLLTVEEDSLDVVVALIEVCPPRHHLLHVSPQIISEKFRKFQIILVLF